MSIRRSTAVALAALAVLLAGCASISFNSGTSSCVYEVVGGAPSVTYTPPGGAPTTASITSLCDVAHSCTSGSSGTGCPALTSVAGAAAPSVTVDFGSVGGASFTTSGYVRLSPTASGCACGPGGLKGSFSSAWTGGLEFNPHAP